MEGKNGSSPSEFKTGSSAQERGLPYVPKCYVVPPTCQAKPCTKAAKVPVIDMAKMRQDGGGGRDRIVLEIGDACRRIGFFQIINHGIDTSVMEEALRAAFEFFELPTKEKEKFMSNDVKKPVRYSASLKDGLDKVQFWRVFLKHYAYPLDQWIHLWPEKPAGYRERVGRYCLEVRKLSLELMGAMTESLGLGSDHYYAARMSEGMQVMAVNCYPPCPNPELALGLPPHSDYSCLTILLQSSAGLEILINEDGEENWRTVPDVKGALQVHVGDHIEAMSNGLYKSVVHRAVVNKGRTRISIASLHSLAMDEKMGVAKELVAEANPAKYKESSFHNFIKFLSRNDLSEGKRFVDTLKVKKN